MIREPAPVIYSELNHGVTSQARRHGVFRLEGAHRHNRGNFHRTQEPGVSLHTGVNTARVLSLNRIEPTWMRDPERQTKLQPNPQCH